ncbi:MAG: R3H domain-containing nucleic acid-binding protein [bacterium]|nr:R3H domain-containing nucleic acid-binding protein [bacterium]
MEQLSEKIKKLLELMGAEDFEINFNEPSKRFSITTNDQLIAENLQGFLEDFEYMINLISQKENQQKVWLDVNNYRRERERLIAELAKAAAHKAIINKEEIQLPPMNAYERRLVHLEIVNHPDLKTESVGEGKERHVIIKPIELQQLQQLQ